MSKSFTVASAKGGVGKTTTTANLGAALAAAGHDVALVDADIGMANLGTMLGIVPEGPTLHDVLSGESDIEEAIYEGPCGMRIIPGSVELEAYAGVDPAKLRDVIETLSEFDGYVLVDSSAGLSHDSSLPLALGDGTLLVSTPDRAALLDTEKTRELAARLGGSVLGVALTRIKPDHPTLNSASEVLGADIVAEVPEDDAVTSATAAQEPLEVHAPHSPAAAAYRELARELTGAPIPEPEPEASETTATTAVSEERSEPESDEGIALEEEPEEDSVPDSAAQATDEDDPEAPSPDPDGIPDFTEDETTLMAEESARTEDFDDTDDGLELEDPIPEAETPGDDADPDELLEGSDPLTEAEVERTNGRDEDEEIVAEAEEETVDEENDADETDADEADADEADDESKESKGFFRRLFGG